ncbi:MAG: PhzF family phenazine biosynthesis protein [Candidatus Bathyarchaeia archaeon]|jgi:trans-2,3-dihydro-3-hydroxyanthranilate isomerase
MPNNTFYIVDVFAQTKNSGNQLAVIINANNLSDDEMQKLANEMHFSETAFILSDKPKVNGYDVRIFTPSIEVPFAGHPTLGTAYVIKHFITKVPTQEITLNLKVGQIKVTCENGPNNQEIFWMQQIQPVFSQKFSIDFFKNLLGLEPSDFDPNYPIQEVSTGLPFIITPLKTLNSVKKARINQKLLSELTKKTQSGILIFNPQTYHKENNLNVRVFVDEFGIPEDPATGSGNGCLAAYLSHYQYFGSPQIDIKVEQGFEIRRPSILHLKTRKIGENIDVYVGGRVFPIAKGKLL